MAVERQQSALPPAQPSYILRGHSSQIHSVCFVRHNTRLLTGDGDGWVVFWKLDTKRAFAVWKAHDAAILGTAEWGRDKLITHGRDNNLRIWQLRPSDEQTFSTILPAEDPALERPKPWLLHTLPVNTLNFCAFSACGVQPQEHSNEIPNTPESIFVAVPARDDKKIEVYQFPEERLRYVVPRVQSTDTGMVMAVKLFYDTSSRSTLVLAGYEGGITAVHRLPTSTGSTIAAAELVYLSKPHSQPILSLDAVPETRTYFTSSADANIASHRIPDLLPADLPSAQMPGNGVLEPVPDTEEELSTILEKENPHTEEETEDQSPKLPKHPNSPPPPKQPEPQPSSSTDPPLSFTKRAIPTPPSNPAGLSSLLSSTTTTHLPPTPTPAPRPPITPQPAHKTFNTKHAGQQSLTVRSDARIFATGGWDARIRIYSTKTLKEVAVLKWHKEGVYAVAFAQIPSDSAVVSEHNTTTNANSSAAQIQRRETGLARIQRQREEATAKRHWVAAGAKDGKVSLWEVF